MPGKRPKPVICRKEKLKANGNVGLSKRKRRRSTETKFRTRVSRERAWECAAEQGERRRERQSLCEIAEQKAIYDRMLRLEQIRQVIRKKAVLEQMIGVFTVTYDTLRCCCCQFC
jgi:hypothetical protein